MKNIHLHNIDLKQNLTKFIELWKITKTWSSKFWIETSFEINWIFFFFVTQHPKFMKIWLSLLPRHTETDPRISLSLYIYIKVKLATIVEGNPKAPFSIATTPMCRGGRYSFPGLLYFTLDPDLIMLSVKQGGIKYHFLSLWYDSTWDWRTH